MTRIELIEVLEKTYEVECMTPRVRQDSEFMYVGWFSGDVEYRLSVTEYRLSSPTLPNLLKLELYYWCDSINGVMQDEISLSSAEFTPEVVQQLLHKNNYPPAVAFHRRTILQLLSK